MSFATAPHLSPAALLDQQACDAQRYRALLHELMDMGMGLARTVHDQATAKGADPAATREAAKAFDLVSRAVRRTVALARHVAQPLPVRAGPARRRTAREVEDVTQLSDSDLGLDPDLDFDAETAKAFRAELSERLDRAELDDEIGHRPIEEVIAEIYRDLGLDRFLGGQKRARGGAQDTEALRAWAARPPGAGPAPDVPRPAPGRDEPWPEPEALPTAPPRDAGADAGLHISDAECAAPMWSVLDEAGWQSPYRPPIREP